MLASWHHLKIFQAIIITHAVDVVNMLIGFKRSTKNRLHDRPMLMNVDTRSITNSRVTIAVTTASVLVVSMACAAVAMADKKADLFQVQPIPRRFDSSLELFRQLRAASTFAKHWLGNVQFWASASPAVVEGGALFRRLRVSTEAFLAVGVEPIRGAAISVKQLYRELTTAARALLNSILGKHASNLPIFLSAVNIAEYF